MISPQNTHRGPRVEKARFRSRKGAVAVLAAILMVVLLAMVAFVVDIGYLVSAKTEMQRTADAAALAAAGEALAATREMADGGYTDAIDYAMRNKAAEVAAENEVIRTSPTLNLATDITVGYLENPADQNEQISFPDPSEFNTVQVRVRYTDEQNQPVSFFFAPLLGIDSQGLSVRAAAMFSSENTVGFRNPNGNGTSTLMPFAIAVEDWNGLLDGTQGTDEWAYDPDTGTISPGQDGIREISMYPAKENSGIGEAAITPGNFGTVDIGSADNSTADLVRQILEGPSAEDFAHLENGSLELDPLTGKLYVNGDTGISAAIGNHALQYVIGDPRTILLYEDVQDPGNNATFTIVGFAGIRVMNYSLHGNQYVIIQPATVIDSGAIVGETDASSFVGPPVRLVR